MKRLPFGAPTGAADKTQTITPKHLSSIAILAACTVLFGAAPALVGSAHAKGKQIVVSYEDLDVSHPAGAQILIGRLQQAASKVCDGQPDIRDLERLALYRACARQAMDEAVASVGEPTVSELYGRPLPQLAAEE